MRTIDKFLKGCGKESTVTNPPKNARHTFVTIGLVLTVLMAAVSLGLLGFQTIFSPVTGGTDADAWAIYGALALYGYALFALLSVVTGLLSTLSGQPYALRTYRIVVITLGVGALLAAVWLMLIALRHAHLSKYPTSGIQLGLWAAACVLAPAVVGAIVVFLRLRIHSKRASVS